MSIFIDTHVHINLIKDFYKKKLNIDFCEKFFLNSLIQNNIKKIICISTNYQDWIYNIQLSNTFENVFFTLGIHPCEIKNKHFLNNSEYNLAILIEDSLKNNSKICAIGECGIDLYHDKNYLKFQIEAFHEQIQLSLKYSLPLIIHTRNAFDETYNILKNYNARAVIHCFVDNFEIAKKWVDLGFKLGIGGNITYPKNNELREAVLKIGLNNIVLETDAPFLSPQSKRSDINTSLNIPEIGKFIADIYNIDIEKFSSKIYENTVNLFNKLTV